MGHLTEGQLQAYLDGEVEGAAARGLAAHLEACATCARTLESMRATAARATRALALVDRPASTAAAFAEVVGARDASARRIDAHRSWGRPARVGFLKAALFVLFAGSAAAAVIPGSPVQRWLGAAWDRLSGGAAPAPEVVPVQPDAEPAAAAEADAVPDVASISIEPADARLRVTLRDAGEAATVRVIFVDRAHATVETDASVNARFSTGPSTIEARGLGAGTVTVSLPRSLLYAIVAVNGQTLLEKDGANVHTPGSIIERSEDAIVFRAN